jgi:hypothetical protein
MARLSDARQSYLLRVDKRFGPLTYHQLAYALTFRTFARERLGIDPHIGQLAFAGLVLSRDTLSPTAAEFLTLVLSSGNRAGKTALLAMLIIFCVLDKTNRPKPPSGDRVAATRWLESEYHWYHFGIAQEVADLVYSDIVRILSGTHDGQGDRGCPLAAAGPVAEWDLKEYGDYRWIRFLPEWGGGQVHFRTTGEKALGSLGKHMHGVSFDEAGIEKNLPFLVREVFNMRRMGTGGQLLLVSTPSEELGSDFADHWSWGDLESPKRLKNWRSMRMSTRDNVGYGISPEMFERLTVDMDERTIRQNIDGEFLQSRNAYFNGENVEACFVELLPEWSPCQPKGIYLQGVDPAKMHDSAWSVVLKLVENIDDPDAPFLVGVKAQQRRGQKSTDDIVGMVYEVSSTYSRNGAICYTAIDATGFGGKMFREALDASVPNVTNVEFGGTIQKKAMLLGDLRTMIDEGRLLLPSGGHWVQVRRQLLRYKREDRKIEQDAVMALVCAVHLLRRTPIGGRLSVEFRL